MSFFKRLFSADYRAAVSAEAAGQLEQAAERYVLAGEHDHAARIHLARAERADSRNTEITALRDALHWAPEDDEELRTKIKQRLGRALLSRIQAEGIATQRDKDKVREAAELLMAGEEYLAAGEAFESIGDTQQATQAYSKGGFVDRVEMALTKDDARLKRERALRDGFANYEMHMRIGERDAARADLRICVEAADKKTEYRRLLDQLESRLITSGVVTLRARQDAAVSAFSGDALIMGRDPLCELPLRSGGVSRQHAEIAVATDKDEQFYLRDLGSRNGTMLSGMPISGAMPLVDQGSFSLGDHCSIEYHVKQALLTLRVVSGMDRERVLIAARAGERIDLDEVCELPVSIQFNDGRPHLSRNSGEVRLKLNDEDVAHGAVQLIHGDQLVVNGVEVEVK